MPKMVYMDKEEKNLFEGAVLCPIENQNCYVWDWKTSRCDDCPLVPSSADTKIYKEEEG